MQRRRKYLELIYKIFKKHQTGGRGNERCQDAIQVFISKAIAVQKRNVAGTMPSC